MTLVCGGLMGADASSSGRDFHPRNPFRGHRVLLVKDPVAATAALSTAQGDKERLTRLAGVPTAVWLTPDADPIGKVGKRVAALAADARARGHVALFVVYGIPARDCVDGESSGGLTPAQYRKWTREIARGTAHGSTTVVLEPDALATAAQCQLARQRVRLISEAVNAFRAQRSVVYLDAGHAHWLPAKTMASLLKRSGVKRARGFAVNVAGYDRVGSELRYARALSRAGAGHFVIDTGRAGLGPDGPWIAGQWCNPPGRAVGRLPHAGPVRSRLDAYLWIKPPGESDGTCNGGPPAGTWWTERAVTLTRNAGW